MTMKIDFLTRLTSSVAITIGLVWAFAPNTSWLPAVTIASGALLYVIGVVGASPRIRETRGYPIVLIALSGITVLIGLIGLLQGGFSTADAIGQILVTSLFCWFCRTSLSMLRSRSSSIGNATHGAA